MKSAEGQAALNCDEIATVNKLNENNKIIKYVNKEQQKALKDQLVQHKLK